MTTVQEVKAISVSLLEDIGASGAFEIIKQLTEERDRLRQQWEVSSKLHRDKNNQIEKLRAALELMKHDKWHWEQIRDEALKGKQ